MTIKEMHDYLLGEYEELSNRFSTSDVTFYLKTELENFTRGTNNNLIVRLDDIFDIEFTGFNKGVLSYELYLESIPKSRYNQVRFSYYSHPFLKIDADSTLSEVENILESHVNNKKFTNVATEEDAKFFYEVGKTILDLQNALNKLTVEEILPQL